MLFTIKGGGYTLYFTQKGEDENIKLDYPSYYNLKIRKDFKDIINAIFVATLIYYNKIYHYDNYPYTSTTNQSSNINTTMKKMNKENKTFKKEEKIKKEKKEKLKKKICES